MGIITQVQLALLKEPFLEQPYIRLDANSGWLSRVFGSDGYYGGGLPNWGFELVMGTTNPYINIGYSNKNWFFVPLGSSGIWEGVPRKFGWWFMDDDSDIGLTATYTDGYWWDWYGS